MIKKEFVIQEVNTGAYDQVWIYDGQGKDQLAYWTGTSSELAEKLNDFYKFCESGRYKVKLQNSKNTGNDLRREECKPKMIPISISGSGGSSENLRAESGSNHYRDKYEDLRLQMLKLEMEQKFSENENTQAAATNEMLLNIFNVISRKPASPSPKIAGSGEQKSDTQEILQKLQEWQELDPDFFLALSGLVDTCKNQPELYKMAKSQIVSNES